LVKYFRQKKTKLVNTKTLTYLDFDDIPNENIVYITRNNAVYRFHNDEIVKLFDYAIFNQHEGFAEPIIPKNPYTNEEFTTIELINIYKIVNSTSKKNILSLRLLHEASYSLEILKELFGSYLNTHACRVYIRELSNKGWERVFNEFIHECGYSRKICFKCIKNQYPNMREIFTPLLVRSMVETNLEYANCKSFLMFNRLIKAYSLRVDKRHYISHRKFVRPVRFSWSQVGWSITPPTTNNESINQTENIVNINESDEDSLSDSSEYVEPELTLVSSTNDEEEIINDTTTLRAPSPVFSSEEMVFTPTDIVNESQTIQDINPTESNIPLFPQSFDTINSIYNGTSIFPTPTQPGNDFLSNLNPDEIHFSIGITPPVSRRDRRRRHMRRRTRR